MRDKRAYSLNGLFAGYETEGTMQHKTQKHDDPFRYSAMFALGEDKTRYRRLETEKNPIEEHVLDGERILKVERSALSRLASEAFQEINHFLRSSHLEQLSRILEDRDASDNDRFVAYDLLKNANIAAGGLLPMCQDTGTALVMGKKGERIWSGNAEQQEHAASDEEALAHGIYHAYREKNLRYSQLSPISMFEEQNTRDNLPAQIELYTDDSVYGAHCYRFLFVAKGGGSANKSFLYQPPPSILDKERMLGFLDKKIRTLGTAACPPYHLAIVIGGTSAEFTLKTAKLASTHYLDGLPQHGGTDGRAFRDRAMEEEILRMTQNMGIGAQFGGKYYCHDVRVIRLPRHGASLPIALSVSCSADRQALGKITHEGIFLEELEHDPARFLPAQAPLQGEVVPIDLTLPMDEIRARLSRYPIKTRLALSGPIVVARDAAHARLRARVLGGEGLPDYFKAHPVYYAGPAKTPYGYASGSFGPTTAGRMDSYVAEFQALGGSMVMLAKGNRAKEVRDACRTYGGFYLGSIGGSAARLAQDCIRSVETLEYPELGMEAIRKIEVENFPAFVVIDDKGNDFFNALDYRGASDHH